MVFRIKLLSVLLQMAKLKLRNYPLVQIMLLLLLLDFIYLFLERGKGRKKEGEKHRLAASHMPPTRDLDHKTQACALTGN